MRIFRKSIGNALYFIFNRVIYSLVSLDCARHEHGTENHPLCGWKINGYTNKKITIRFI